VIFKFVKLALISSFFDADQDLFLEDEVYCTHHMYGVQSVLLEACGVQSVLLEICGVQSVLLEASHVTCVVCSQCS
jgi:hypothetical protein